MFMQLTSHLTVEQPVAVSQTGKDQPRLLLDGFSGNDHTSPTQVLDEAAIEAEDDDYWDVQSDEDMLDVEYESEESLMLASKDFANIRRIHVENSDELGIRRYNAFLYDGILAHYKPEYAASPLRNPKTARVFAHYIHVVSASLARRSCFLIGIVILLGPGMAPEIQDAPLDLRKVPLQPCPPLTNFR
jgi:hypothetical protein